MTDTSRITEIDAGIADTTMNMLHGYVVDFANNKPIQNAIVILQNGNQKFATSTNQDGFFKIHQFFSINAKWVLLVSKPGYQCLNIRKIMYVNYEEYRIKLKKEK